jgi:hypothetical protein
MFFLICQFMFLVLEHGWGSKCVLEVSFKSKFDVFVGCHWGCSYKV